ncbi:MAG: YchJ family protein [Legionellaceae bacterium]|nr:YchJ family protein [Legionellaceae bacterium]
MLLCACGSKCQYSSCCAPYLSGEKAPNTPEALMRSRYVAYTQANINYIQATMRGVALEGFNVADAAAWARRVTWVDLQVLNVPKARDATGQVEFIARFVEGERMYCIHETSQFLCDNGRWFYVDGEQTPHAPQKVLRNSACPCASGKKFKQCHGRK